MAIYVDLVVILNFLVDLLLLLGTNRLSGFPTALSRCVLASALGGLYSGACLLPGFRFLGSLLWRTVSLGLMSLTAFGMDISALKRGGVFVLLSMALGGMALSLGRGSIPSLMLAAGLVWMLCRFSVGQQVGQREYVPVTLHYGGNTASFLALRDTGNTLRDPVTGEPVVVVAGHIGQRLTGLTEAQLRDPMGTMLTRPVSGLRLIPYRAVGQSGAMLLGLRIPQAKLGSREQSLVVAFAPEGLGKGEVYQALTGGAV